MNKPNSFRKAITAAVPSLAVDPDKLLVFVDQGNIVGTGAASLSFEYRYKLNVIVTDFAGNADAIFVALMGWIRRNQSDLLTNDDKRRTGISFEVDHLTQDTCDVSIKVDVTESVVVGTNEAGEQTITHVDEPAYEWDATGLVAGDAWTT
ncbi:MAG TPA: phage tail protein [Candidatus Elarobacter sp.]|nr:phage tail protein [Candidatus Elarobacter sp.]